LTQDFQFGNCEDQAKIETETSTGWAAEWHMAGWQQEHFNLGRLHRAIRLPAFVVLESAPRTIGFLGDQLGHSVSVKENHYSTASRAFRIGATFLQLLTSSATGSYAVG